MDELLQIPLLPISAKIEYEDFEEARSDALDDALTQFARAVLDFEKLSEEEYKKIVDLYLSYVVTKYGFSENEILYKLQDKCPDDSIACVLTGFDIIFFKNDITKKPKRLQDFINLIDTIEHEMTHIHQNQKAQTLNYKKITNEQGYYIESQFPNFFVYLNSRIYTQLLSNNITVFDDLRCRKYWAHPNEIEARKNAINGLGALYAKIKEVYLKEAKIPQNKRRNKEVALPENAEIVKNYVYNSAFCEAQIEMQFIKRPEEQRKCEERVKGFYHCYLNDCLKDGTGIVKNEWTYLAVGMQFEAFYDQNLADALFEKSLENEAYEACLYVLNAKDYPADIEKMKEIIWRFKDDEKFLQNYYQICINYDRDFLADLYNQVVEKSKLEEDKQNKKNNQKSSKNESILDR